MERETADRIFNAVVNGDRVEFEKALGYYVALRVARLLESAAPRYVVDLAAEGDET